MGRCSLFSDLDNDRNLCRLEEVFGKPRHFDFWFSVFSFQFSVSDRDFFYPKIAPAEIYFPSCLVLRKLANRFHPVRVNLPYSYTLSGWIFKAILFWTNQSGLGGYRFLSNGSIHDSSLKLFTVSKTAR